MNLVAHQAPGKVNLEEAQTGKYWASNDTDRRLANSLIDPTWRLLFVERGS
jgi:hypothetical protein